MRILTTDGSATTVSTRKWPLAGITLPQPSVMSAMGTIGNLTLVGSGETISYSRLYKENPWVNAAVRSIAWGMSRMVVSTYERMPDGQRTRIRWDLPGQPGRLSAARDLDRQLNTGPPADRGGPQRRLRRTMVDYLVHGNALWVIEDDGLWHVPWKRVNVLEGDRVPVLGYEIIGTTGNRFLAPEQVIHFNAADDPDSPIGVPPMSALRHTLTLHEAIQRHLIKFFENSMRPSGNLRLDRTASKDAIEAIRNQISELYSSPDNAGKVLVTTGEFQAMTAAHEQSQLIELVKLSREEIAGVFRVPLPVLGALENAIKSNVKELREQYIRDVIGAWAPSIEDDLMAQLVHPNPMLRGHFVEFDMDEHLRPDLEGMAAAMVSLERTLTTNERRRKLNAPDLPYPEADTVPSIPGGGYLGIESKEPAEEQDDDLLDEDDGAE